MCNNNQWNTHKYIYISGAYGRSTDDDAPIPVLETVGNCGKHLISIKFALTPDVAKCSVRRNAFLNTGIGAPNPICCKRFHREL